MSIHRRAWHLENDDQDFSADSAVAPVAAPAPTPAAFNPLNIDWSALSKSIITPSAVISPPPPPAPAPAPAPAFTAGPLAPQKFDLAALQSAFANIKLPVAPAPVAPAPVAAPPAPAFTATPLAPEPFDFSKLSQLLRPATQAPATSDPEQFLVRDAQYRGEPLIKNDSGVNYAAYVPPAPVATPIAPPPAVVASAPPPVAPALTAAPPSFTAWMAEQQKTAPKFDYGNPWVPRTGAADEAAWNAQKAQEYQKLYGAQLEKNLPSFSDYLALQQAAFVPTQNANWNPFAGYADNDPPEQYTSFDRDAARQKYEALGGKLTPTENWSYITSNLPSKEAISQTDLVGAVARQEYERGINRALASVNPDAVKEGYRINGFQGYDKAWKYLGKDYYSVRPVNPDGTLGAEKIIYHEDSSFLGGLGDVLKTVAPIALSFAAPGLGTAIGTALGATGTTASALGGALLGAGTSAITGGDPLKGALTGGLTPVVSSGIGSLTSGMDPSIVKAAQGAGTALVKGAVTGNIDPASILASGATGYLSTPIANAVKEYVPETGSTTLDNIIRNTAIQTPGTLIRGGDLGDLATNVAIGEAVKTATGYIPKTDVDFVDKIIAGTAGKYLTDELRDVLGDTPSSRPPVVAQAPAPAPAPAAADSTTTPPAQAPAAQPSPAQDNSGLIAMLLAAGLMGDEGQDQTQAPPQLFQAPTLATLPGQLPGQLGGQPTSLAELMALLNTRRA